MDTPRARPKLQRRHPRSHAPDGLYGLASWNASWNVQPGKSWVDGAIRARSCAICPGSAHGALGRTSCKRQVSGSNPLTGSQVPRSGPGRPTAYPAHVGRSAVKSLRLARHSKITFAAASIASRSISGSTCVQVFIVRPIWLWPNVFITVRGEAPAASRKDAHEWRRS